MFLCIKVGHGFWDVLAGFGAFLRSVPLGSVLLAAVLLLFFFGMGSSNLKDHRFSFSHFWHDSVILNHKNWDEVLIARGSLVSWPNLGFSFFFSILDSSHFGLGIQIYTPEN